MEFKGINRHTVQCIISEEEMNEYGVHVEDFINNRESLHGFIDHVVEECIDELGYFPSGGAIAMQVAKDRNGYFNILMTDEIGRRDDMGEMMRNLKNISGSLADDKTGKTAADSGDSNDYLPDDLMKRIMNEIMGKSVREDKHTGVKKKSSQDRAKKTLSVPKLFRFESIEEMSRFAGSSGADGRISSSVYKDEESGDFYLLVRKGKLSPENFAAAVLKMKEFSEPLPSNYATEQYCREHYRTLIKKHALEILRKYDL